MSASYCTTVEMKPDTAIVVEQKRFYVPAVLRSTCPTCGARYERDLEAAYLSEPPCGVPFTERLYCQNGDCAGVWNVSLRLDVRTELTALPTSGAP